MFSRNRRRLPWARAGSVRLLGLSQKNITVWGTSVGHGFTHWYPSTFYLLLPLIKDEMGLSYTEMGFLITARYLVSAVGVQFSFQAGLSALSPVLGGWIADAWGLVYTFYFLAAILLLSNLLVFFIKEPERPEEIRPETA